jgi:hypothetical protein
MIEKLIPGMAIDSKSDGGLLAGDCSMYEGWHIFGLVFE